MQFRGGINELMRQAARMQRKIDQAKDELKAHEANFEAVGGKVKVTVTFGRQIKRIEIDPEFYKNEAQDLVLDSVCAAVTSALEVAEKQLAVELEKVTGGVKIPGMT